MLQTYPIVSVVVPCYNGERFIDQAIESILNQSYQAFQVIVVDDGSTDSSKKVVKKFLSDPRVRLVEHPENRGIAAARNTGIRETASPYIAFLDQDDLWRPDKLEKQVAVLESDIAGEIGLVFSDQKIVVEDKRFRNYRSGKIPKCINEASREKVIRNLYLNCFITMTVLVRRRCFDEVGLLDEQILSGADDYDFYSRLVSRYKIFHIAEPLAIRREHGANYTDFERTYPDTQRIVRRLLKENPELSSIRSRCESALLYILGRVLGSKGERERAKRAYRDSLRTRPWFLKPLIALMLCNMGRFGDRVFRYWQQIRNYPA